jgi:hypothetical protein
MIKTNLSIKPFIFSFLILVLTVFAAHFQVQPIEPKLGDVPQDQFSAARAFEQLHNLTADQVPHSVDTQANRVVENRMVERLRSLGYKEEIQQEFVCKSYHYGKTNCTTIRNIIVSKKGNDTDLKSKNAILLSAHYDSVPAGPGASDAGVAVATLLEVARLLNQLGSIKNDVVFLFNEGEEFGLLGAQAFMQNHPSAKKIKLAINIEARGTTGKSVLFETGEDSGWLVQHYFDNTPSAQSSSLFYEVYKFLPNDTDLTVFKKHGLQGLNFAHADAEPHYHTPLDNLDNLNLGSLQHHGDNVWGVLKSIVNIDLEQTQTGNLVYTDIFGLFGVQWQESSSPIIAVLLFIIAAALITTLKSKENIRLSKVFIGLLVMIVTLFICSGMAWLVQYIVQQVASTSTPWRANQLPMMITLWLAIFSVGLFFIKSLFKSFQPIELVLSLLILFTGLAVVSSLIMAGISFLFIIPSFVCCLLLLIFVGISHLKQNFNQTENKSKLTVIMAAILLITIMILFIPIVKVLEIMVSYPLSIAMGMILGFVIIGFSPLLIFANLNTQSNQHFNHFISATSLISVVFLMITQQQSAFSKNMPQGLNLFYVQNESSASILSGGSWQHPSDKLLTEFASYQLAASLPWRQNQYYTEEFQHQQLNPLQFSVKNIEPNNNQRTIHVSVNDNSQDFMGFLMFIPLDSNIGSIKIGEKKINIAASKNYFNGYYQLYCQGLSCTIKNVEITAKGTGETKVLLVKVLSGLPLPLKHRAKNARVNSVPRHLGNQSFVISEIEI